MDTDFSTRSDDDPAILNLARKSHFPVGDVEKLYENEMSRLSVGARIKSFLSIFALRNVRKILRDRSLTKQPPVEPGDLPEDGFPVLLTDPLLPFGQPVPIEQAIASRNP